MVRALPREIREREAGKDSDVIADNDMPLHPGEEPRDEVRAEPVIAHAERGAKGGGGRGTGVPPALTVPYEIKDEATGEVLDEIQDDDPDLPAGVGPPGAAGPSTSDYPADICPPAVGRAG